MYINYVNCSYSLQVVHCDAVVMPIPDHVSTEDHAERQREREGGGINES